jgi:hypothetical protein
VDTNSIEAIEARWFVNYDFHEPLYRHMWRSPPDVVSPSVDTTDLTRVLPSFTFQPYTAPPPYGTTAPMDPSGLWTGEGIVRVVEVVVSNGFDPASVNSDGPAANRAVKQGFETAAYRWVFLTVSQSQTIQCPVP